MGLCRVEKGHTYALEEFRWAQFNQLNEVRDRNSTSLDKFKMNFI